jgi:glycosyltransferase involved in cell wall biosynthesis
MPDSTSVVILSSVEWNFTWQRHQILATALAARGFQVVYVDPLPKRLPSIREVRRVLGRLTGIPQVSGYPRQSVHQSVSVISPIALPDVNDVFELVNRAFFLPRLYKRLRSLTKRSRLVILTYLPFPGPLSLACRLAPDLLIYDCVTRWAEDERVPRGRLRETELFQKADLVMADSPFLYEQAMRYNPRTHRLPPGVDFDLFQRAANISAARSGQPIRCCYFGGVGGQHIDVELLATISHRYQLRIVGPVRTNIPRLAPTAELVGVVPHPELPEYLADSDVIVLPYRVNEFTRAVHPAKTFECLATGKPIVVTRLPSLVPYADLLYISDSHHEFLSNVERAMLEPPQLRERRIELARRNTWDKRVDKLEGLIFEALA